MHVIIQLKVLKIFKGFSHPLKKCGWVIWFIMKNTECMEYLKLITLGGQSFFIVDLPCELFWGEDMLQRMKGGALSRSIMVTN